MRTPLFILLGAFAGVVSGFLNMPIIFSLAAEVAHVVENLLKLISVPIIFFSIVSTIGGMNDAGVLRRIGGRILFYTILTTLMAASVALGLFILVNPVSNSIMTDHILDEYSMQVSYLSFFREMVPSNIIDALSGRGSVISVVIVALLMGIAILSVDEEPKKTLQSVFSGFFEMFLHMAQFVLYTLPFGVWAFVTLFFKNLDGGAQLWSLAGYLLVVVGANIVQAVLVLPALVLLHGANPYLLFVAMRPALLLAFFSKSSNATLPLTLKCARERAGISSNIANITLPLCSTINMNGCAAFILVTVLFVCMSAGYSFTLFDMFIWIGLSTIAAVGNAGVPMGCFFLANAFLAHMNVPLHLMGVILPFYAVIDMIETVVNVWSDSVVALLVDLTNNNTSRKV